MVVHLLEMTWGHDHNSVSDGGFFAAGRCAHDLLWLTNLIMLRLRWGRGLLFLAASPQRCHSRLSPCGGVCCVPKRRNAIWVTLSSSLVGFLPFISHSVGLHLPLLYTNSNVSNPMHIIALCHRVRPRTMSWWSKFQGCWTSVGCLLGHFAYSAKRGPGMMHVLHHSSSAFCHGT